MVKVQRLDVGGLGLGCTELSPGFRYSPAAKAELHDEAEGCDTGYVPARAVCLRLASKPERGGVLLGSLSREHEVQVDRVRGGRI